jgi:hypothetical protein
MALTTDELARLAALRKAYDDLITGKKVTRVSIGGRLVEYGAGDMARIKQEVDSLSAKNMGRTRGAVRFRI